MNELQEKILARKRETNTLILAHYYQSLEVQDVADAVSLMCSDKLRYTTGNYIDVDGGFHITRL